MNKKKTIIILVVIGAVLIVAFVAISLVRQQATRMGGYQTMEGVVSSPKSMGVPSVPGLSRSESTILNESPVAGDISQSGSEEFGAIDKKIIKNGNLTLKVSSVEKAAEDVAKIATANEGEVFSTNFYQTAGNMKNGNITVKVPVANFEKTFSEMKKVASLVVSESTSGQDVTEQYTDLQSRLKNKQAEEQAFAKILERSGEIDDVLKVTRELARVRGEIEILQGRIRLLESQTDMATITATLSEDPKITITDKWRPLQIIKETLNSLLKDIQKFVNFVIVLVIRVVPVIILYAIVVWIAYLIGRKIYRKVKSRNDPGT